MNVRDRIQELRRVPASELEPHPRNWRTHPTEQQDALRGVLAEIGYADALLARELPGGRLQLIDGHLRAETTPDSVVPVLVLDLDEAEAEKLLLTHDPLASLAGADEGQLASLLADVGSESPAVQALLDDLGNTAASPDAPLDEPADRPDINVGVSYQVVVECRDEDDQQQVYERLTAEGYACRLAIL